MNIRISERGRKLVAVALIVKDYAFEYKDLREGTETQSERCILQRASFEYKDLREGTETSIVIVLVPVTEYLNIRISERGRKPTKGILKSLSHVFEYKDPRKGTETLRGVQVRQNKRI